MSSDWISTQGYPYIIFGWCLFAIATPCFFMRLFIQLRSRIEPWREIFVILAYICYIIYTVTESLRNDWDSYNPTVDWELKENNAEAVATMKAEYARGIVCMQILYACKATLLCLYMELASRRNFPSLWWVMVFTWVCVGIGSLNDFFYNTLHCLGHYGDNFKWPESQTCSWSHVWQGSTYVIHLGTDLLVFTIPFFILRKLTNLTTKEKWGASGMFALGFLNIACATVFFTYMLLQMTHDDFFVSLEIYAFFFFMWEFQAGTAIIIVCLPSCRRFCREIPEIVRNYRSKSRTPNPSSSGGTQTTTDLENGQSPTVAIKDGEVEIGVQAVMDPEMQAETYSRPWAKQ